MKTKSIKTKSMSQTQLLGEHLGQCFRGGEVIELSSDLGGGKTTLVQGLVRGFGSADVVSSPSFTISNVYSRSDGKEFHHFDFYRLSDPGIVASELQEVIGRDDFVVAVEWADSVKNVIPKEHIKIIVNVVSGNERMIHVTYPDELHYLFKNVKDGEVI